ncbi:50S ribosomal protein L25/general stress protein Ctc [Deinococcus arenicola]|uniref:Large ribosomal subunit protein bL25 n=1 Tax=Deinococcus arenicola TaxID=2994950 RepID=A0ABU4DLC1_9DEIO|nr:50S ribosomal protein L25/general stress protein Ctc [Deinococcus sp. ZS9-10]MDV6373230.1 50S ribosomal protein L25/general stress protein Ctc [Deinococcus sp. ZS9-10]
MELNAQPRKSREKLAEGMIPAVAYNKENNVSFALNLKAFDRAFRQTSTTGLYDITVEGGETFPALVKAIQMDKRRRVPIHVDFYMVTYGEAVEVSVPVHTKGKSQGVVMGGLLDIVIHNLAIIAPGPRRIPQELVVDVSKLQIGDHITAGQITLPEGVKLNVADDQVVISLLPPRMTTEEAEAETQAAQVAGLVASGELSEEAAAAVLEGEATLEEAKADTVSEAGVDAAGESKEDASNEEEQS